MGFKFRIVAVVLSIFMLKNTAAFEQNSLEHRVRDVIGTMATTVEQHSATCSGCTPAELEYRKNLTNITDVSNGNVALKCSNESAGMRVHFDQEGEHINDSCATTDAPEAEVSVSETAGGSSVSDGIGPIVKSGEVVLSLTGFVVNAMTCVILARHGRGFSRFTLLLFLHQSVVDGYLCVAATALFLQPAMWSTGVRTIDWLVCRLWHTQFLYWMYALVSAWNIVFMAVDRCVAVCWPTRYKRVQSRHVVGTFVAMHVGAFAASVPPLFMVRFTADGSCERGSSLSPDVTEKLFYGYAIFYLLAAYLGPVVTFVVLYSYLLAVIRRRMRPVSQGTANVLSTATLRVTKCAVAVTTIFILTIGYDTIYFFISSMGVMEYEFDSAKQHVGVVLNLCNTVANPFIYAILLPTFRQSMRKTFRCTHATGGMDQSSTYESSQSAPTANTVMENAI